ncbi:hypothetical protein MRX96_003551 [Rhipicephalus microplus]
MPCMFTGRTATHREREMAGVWVYSHRKRLWSTEGDTVVIGGLLAPYGFPVIECAVASSFHAKFDGSNDTRAPQGDEFRAARSRDVILRTRCAGADTSRLSQRHSFSPVPLLVARAPFRTRE